jgi:hypothetical protein
MWGFFSQRLTEFSNHYVDWSRIGELLKSGTHRYSKEELIVRGEIIAFTAASAFLGDHLNNPEKTGCTDLTISIAAGVIGFVVSHTVAISYLMSKRHEMSKECARLVTEIKVKMQEMQPPLSQLDYRSLNELIIDIQEVSLSDKSHSRASQTWGYRKNLLAEVSNSFHQNEIAEVILQKGKISAITQNLQSLLIKQIRLKMQEVQPPLSEFWKQRLNELITHIQEMSFTDLSKSPSSLLTKVKNSFHTTKLGKVSFQKEEISAIIKDM